MNSRIYRGSLLHVRLTPVPHRFVYPVFTLALDLDELPTLDREVRGFGYNRFRPLSLYDADYLDPDPGSIREKLERHLDRTGYDGAFERVELITTARWMNYSFNPVSIYYVYGEGDTLACSVAEVNNTFGGRHLYVLTDPTYDESGTACYTRSKEFHVSPFNDMQGEYRFRMAPLGKSMGIGIDLIRDGETVLVTELTGESVPFTSRSLAGTLTRFPFSTFLTMPRILGQAARLYYRKHLQVYKRPEPHSPDTIIPGNEAKFDASRFLPH